MSLALESIPAAATERDETRELPINNKMVKVPVKVTTTVTVTVSGKIWAYRPIKK